MDRTTSAHSSQDELLIVRLFGGDVDDRERSLALNLLGECDECSALFSDIGATADAMAAMPVPARPRDFSLTEADAARLRRWRRGLGLVSVFGRTRSIGGVFVAIGLVGIVLVGSLGVVGGAGGTTNTKAANFGPAEIAASSDGSTGGSRAGFGPDGLGTQVPAVAMVTSGAPMPTAVSDTTVITASSPVPSQAAVPAAPSSQTDPFVATVTPAPGEVAPSVPTPAPSASAGLDARLIWLGGFGLLFLLGLLVLLVPLMWRRRVR
jgi:hypothetical protein